MFYFLRFITALVVSAALPTVGLADPLKSFFDGIQTARAKFTQTVIDKGGKKVQESHGTLALSKPGKFRWQYEKPYRQLIVSDGARVWIYDEDLQQVTVKKLDQAIGNTPAALLAGSADIGKAFNLRSLPPADDMEWVEATPKGTDVSFSAIQMGFKNKTMAVMKLTDSFGQTSVIHFSQFERNPSLPADHFKFAPPKGADVIGER